jgi:hypothetical protein
VKLREVHSGTLPSSRQRSDDICPVRSFHYIVRTKSNGRAHATHFMSSARQTEQIHASAEICSGAAVCFAIMIHHELQMDRYVSLKATQTVDGHDARHRGWREPS